MRQQLDLNPVLAHLTVEEPEGSGVAAVRELLNARQRGDLRAAWATHAGRIPGAAVEALRLAWAAQIHHRRFVSARAEVSLRVNAAQDAPSLSRVTLGSRGDAMGVPEARVDWRISAHEIATLRRFALQLRAALQAPGADSLPMEGVDWLPELFTPDAALPGIEDARHAMGGARMGQDPRSSVVSPELAVHGVANLWIASAATFPTGTAQLPTLPLMALSLRLADRIERALDVQPAR
jgi:choline dehydrogenase-like flavoprotein